MKHNKPSKRDDSAAHDKRKTRAINKTERELNPGNHTCPHCPFSCGSANILDIHTALAH